MSLTSLRNKTNKSAKVVVGIAAFGMLAAAFTGLGSILFNQRTSTATSNEQPDDVIATVNGDPIIRSTFTQFRDRVMANARDQGQPVSLMQMCGLNGELMNKLDEDTLKSQIAKAKGIQVTDADVNKAKATQLSSYALQMGLKANASEGEVNDKASELGAPPFQFDDASVRKDLLVQKYEQSQIAAAHITEDDARQQYISVHTQHIFIGKNHPAAQAQALETQILAQLAKGADFATLAKADSDDPMTKTKGGDDGWVTKDTNQLPDGFKTAARSLTKGEYTKTVVSTPQGDYIIKLLDTKNDIPKDFDKTKANQIQQMAQAKAQVLDQQDLDKAKAGQKLDIKDERLKLDHDSISLQSMAGGPDQASITKLITSYNKLLKTSTDGEDKAQIDAEIGQLYAMTDNNDAVAKAQDQVTAFLAALTAFGHDDPELDMKLGDLYQQLKQNDNAVKYYQLASENTYSKPQMHFELSQDFTKIGRKDLSKAEMTLAMDEYASQQSSRPGAMAPAPAPQPQPRVTAVTAPPAVGGKPMPPGTVSIRPTMTPNSGTITIGKPGQPGMSIPGGPHVQTINVQPGKPAAPPIVMPQVPPPVTTKPSVMFSPPPKPTKTPVHVAPAPAPAKPAATQMPAPATP